MTPVSNQFLALYFNYRINATMLGNVAGSLNCFNMFFFSHEFANNGTISYMNRLLILINLLIIFVQTIESYCIFLENYHVVHNE